MITENDFEVKSFKLFQKDGSTIDINLSVIGYFMIFDFDRYKPSYIFNAFIENHGLINHIFRFWESQKSLTIDMVDGRSFVGEVVSLNSGILSGNIREIGPYAKHHAMAREICRGG